jgi:hypothetical protein
MSYQVFLPQRDGVDRDKQPYDKMTKEERRLVMFQVDTTKIMESDVFLFVLDGRVPDEGQLLLLEHYRNFRVLVDFTKEVEQG